MIRRVPAFLAFALLSAPFGTAMAGGLGGSMASMRRQYAVARQNDYTFLRTSADVREFVREDRLVPLVSNRDLLINSVSFPYARPAVKLFVERLAAQYRDATGDRLVVTSLTRPLSRQPRNAHRLSVHPAGMAVDLRVPRSARARRWLESTLLSLEESGVLDATRERRPPHYHVAVFPDRYESYVDRISGSTGTAVAESKSDSAGLTEPAAVVASLEPDSMSSAHTLDDALDTYADHDPWFPEPALPLGMIVGAAGLVVAVTTLRRK